MQPQTITSASVPSGLAWSAIPEKINSSRVRNLATIEVIKNLSINYRYTTPRRIHNKLLKPKKKDVEIVNLKSAKIPLLIANFQFKNYNYPRICVAPTGKFVVDKTTTCALCKNAPIVACLNCGAIVCESHSKKCLQCGKDLCTKCVVSKGIISKKYYCAEHKPQD